MKNKVLVIFLFSFLATAKPNDTLTVESDIANKAEHIEAHTRKTLTCRSNNYRKIIWLDPAGRPVPRTGGRVLVHHVSSRQRGSAAVLVLSPAEVKDTGVWACRTRGGRVDVPICVIESTEFITSHKELSQDQGRAATLDCETRGSPEPRLAWYRNHQHIFDEDNSTKYLVMNRYTTNGLQSLLTIKSVTLEDSGEYICKAVQDSPAMSSCHVAATFNITLHVNAKPIFQDGDRIHNAFGRDERIQLNCTASGYPPPVYSWFLEKDKDVLEDLKSTEFLDSIYNVTEETLEILANDITHGKRYRCRAINTYGYADKVFQVLSVVKPTLPSSIQLLNRTDNELVLYLLWEKEAIFPIDEILVQYTNDKSLDVPEWIHFDDIVITTGNASFGCKVELTNLEGDTEYWVRVNVSNNVGKSEWSESYSFHTGSDELRALTTIVEEQLRMGIYGFLLLITVAVSAWICCYYCQNVRC